MEIYLTPSLPMNRTGISQEKLRENIKFTYQDLGGSESWLLSPDEDKDGSERLPVKKPARYTAHMFAKLCGMRGHKPPRAARTGRNARRRERNRHAPRPAPLADIVDLTLTYSINLMAELMMLAAAKELTGTAMKLDGAARELSSYLSGRLEKISWKEFGWSTAPA